VTDVPELERFKWTRMNQTSTGVYEAIPSTRIVGEATRSTKTLIGSADADPPSSAPKGGSQ
jgi:hypothetical protein